MRVSKDKSALSRIKILNSAISMFLKEGIDSSGLTQIMENAGFTKGGFYKHFESKENLIADACAKSSATRLKLWSLILLNAHNNQNGLFKIAEGYLSETHINSDSVACVIANHGNDAVRHSEEVNNVFLNSLENILSFLSEAIESESYPESRSHAINYFAKLIGGYVMLKVSKDKPSLFNEIKDALLLSIKSDLNK